MTEFDVDVVVVGAGITGSLISIDGGTAPY